MSLATFHPHFVIRIFPSAFYHPQFPIRILWSAFFYSPSAIRRHSVRTLQRREFSCAGCSACYVGETNRHLATRVREHLTSNENSRIFQRIHGSETCRALCSENCFSILDTASTSFQLRIKEALHIRWENPSLNKQVNHVNLIHSLKKKF